MSKVSVVLPCLNEERGVGICINKIKEVFHNESIDGEIIIVDNGCTDNTIDVVKSFNLGNITVVNEPKKGYGNAYRAGFKHVGGDIIIMGDADNSYDFYDIPRFLDSIKSADFVTGHRKVMKKGSMPFLHKYIGKPMFSFILRRFFNINVSDSHCGFGAIKKEALEKLELRSSGMEFASEILIKAKRNNLNIREIPIVYSPRIGKSKLRTFRDGARHLKLILKQAV